MGVLPDGVVSPGVSSGVSEPRPLAPAEEIIWLRLGSVPSLKRFNIAYGFELLGRFDTDALTRALEAVVARHPALRTSYADEGGQPVRVVSPAIADIVSVLDMSGVASPDRRTFGGQLLNTEAGREFDLSVPPLFRFTLARFADDHAVLVLVVHHIWRRVVDAAALRRYPVPSTAPR